MKQLSCHRALSRQSLLAKVLEAEGGSFSRAACLTSARDRSRSETNDEVEAKPLPPNALVSNMSGRDVRGQSPRWELDAPAPLAYGGRRPDGRRRRTSRGGALMINDVWHNWIAVVAGGDPQTVFCTVQFPPLFGL